MRTLLLRVAVLPLAAVLLNWSARPALALNPFHECASCHSLHAAPGQNLLTDPVVELVCMACHDPDVGTAARKANVHTNKVGSTKAAFRISCIQCHDSHDSMANAITGQPNLMMVGRDADTSGFARISTPNSGIRDVAFQSRGTDAGGPFRYSFADGDDDGDGLYSGVCEVCHTDTVNHQNGTVLPDQSNHGHNVGLNCTVCHPHVESFWGSGGACNECHNTPQDNGDGLPVWQTGRREIISEFARFSHHVQGVPFAEADCTACHLQDRHQQGEVRLKDPDNPASPTPLVVLTGDPLTNPTEAAKLTIFCLACHDSNGYDGANPTLPFTDGNTPPDVATTWTNAAHNTVGALSCFGEGTTGCHGSGHGSEKQMLLALADVPPDPTTRVEEEEGFCFTCHTSGGISTVDVESGFATAILWADDQVQSGNANLNDRHDVQWAAQNVSGAKVECTDCHDPHAANAGNPPISLLKADPDPTDGRVPGSGWFATLSGGLGTDHMSEWCLDCHDGSFPAGVQNHTPVPLTDILNEGTSWLTNSHGAGGSAAALKTGYAGGAWALDDVVPCLACHKAHPNDTPQAVTPTLANNLFQLRDVIVAKDGATAVPSDDSQGTFYELTTLTSRRQTPNQDNVNSWYLCNTCHTGSMGSGKSNCSDCHAHGDSRF